MTANTIVKYFSRGLLAMVALASCVTAHAALLTSDNWRLIYMNGQYTSGGANDNSLVYAVHRPRQENLLVHFDVSAFAGGTVTGDATLSMVIAPNGSSGSSPIEAYQLNAYNSTVDLDNAGSYFRDGSLQWVDNSGSTLSNLNFDNSVQQIGALLDTNATGTATSVGNIVDFVISQTTIQSWIDGALPSIVILSAATNSPYSAALFDMAASNLDFGVEGTASSSVPLPASLGLMLLGLAGIRHAMARGVSS